MRDSDAEKHVSGQKEDSDVTEFQRFLRYTIPGLVCVAELVLILLVSDAARTETALRVMFTDQGIAAVLVLFLGSGAIGYIFAQIYFALVFAFDILEIDERRPLRLLRPKYFNLVRITDTGDFRTFTDMEVERISRNDAWKISTLIIDTRRDSDKAISGIGRIDKTLVDITHSLGAAWVGTVLAWVAWYVIHVHQGCLETLLVCALWLGLAIVFFWCRWKTLKRRQSLINSIVIRIVLQDYRLGRPMQLHFSD